MDNDQNVSLAKQIVIEIGELLKIYISTNYGEKGQNFHSILGLKFPVLLKDLRYRPSN